MSTLFINGHFAVAVLSNQSVDDICPFIRCSDLILFIFNLKSVYEPRPERESCASR